MNETNKDNLRTWIKVASLYQKVFRQLADRLAEVGLSVAQFDLLACLVHAEPQRLKQSELADRLLVTKGNISGMLTRMTDLGMVERTEDASDKRKKRILITEQGRSLFEEGRAVQESLVAELFLGIEEGRVKIVEEVVGRVGENVDQLGC